jgi:hypothetical protein
VERLRRGIVWLGGVSAGFCAGLLAFVAVFGAIAMAIATPLTEEPTCWPHYSVFGITQTFCESKAAEAVWWGTVDLARFVVVIPTVALHLYITVLTIPGNEQWLDDAFMWTLWSLPVALVALIGFRHWYLQSKLAAWGLLLLLVAQVIVGALQL